MSELPRFIFTYDKNKEYTMSEETTTPKPATPPQPEPLPPNPEPDKGGDETK